MDDQSQPQFDYQTPQVSQGQSDNLSPPQPLAPPPMPTTPSTKGIDTNEPPDMFAALDSAPNPTPPAPSSVPNFDPSQPNGPATSDALLPPSPAPTDNYTNEQPLIPEDPSTNQAAAEAATEAAFNDDPQPLETSATPTPPPLEDDFAAIPNQMPPIEQPLSDNPPQPTDTATPQMPQLSNDTSSLTMTDTTPVSGGTVYSGLSGNEMYCLNMIGYRPGNLVVGNSVYALGFLGGVTSNVRTKVGGEINEFTNMISSGRKLAIQRLEQELGQLNGAGATGVTSELIFHPGHIEFLSVGSAIYRQDGQSAAAITSSSDGQEFFCQVDAGYNPTRFVLGNIAYSIGIAGNIIGELKEMVKGEIKTYSDVFNVTRNTALQRITQEAKDAGANSVIGIRTTILPIDSNGVQEMVMLGTASTNPQIAQVADSVGGVVSSDLTAEETWNITRLGYVPLKLILGTSVYSIGVAGGIRAAIRGYFKGEISALTQMIYGAREQSLKRVQQQAQQIGADDVLGIKTYIYQLDGDVIEFLAIGTAVKKVPGVTTHSEQIPPQAIMGDKTTFVNTANAAFNTTLNESSVDHQNQKNIV